MKAITLLVAVATACSAERMPALHVEHRGTPQPLRKVVVVATECRDMSACAGVSAIVASELAFRGIEILDLDRLPARERERTSVEISKLQIRDGVEHSTTTREVTVTGSSYSDVDVWTLRAALGPLGVDGVVRVRVAELPLYPRRVFSLVRITRPSDAVLIAAYACELEVSRLDSLARVFEQATRCALEGIAGGKR